MKSENQNWLEQSVQYLKSVGPKRAESFAKIGIKTIRDLLFYFPSRHLDRTTTLTAAKAYQYLINGYDGEITIIGKVVDKEKLKFGAKELFKVHFKDTSGFFECVWFQGIKYFEKNFSEGDIYAISSKPLISKYGNLQFTHPDFDKITEEESQNFISTGKIIPFYKIPKELRETNIGDLSIRKIISHCVEKYADNLEETLPEEIVKLNNLLPINTAVKNYHFPESSTLLNSALSRFKFEEIFYIEILVALRQYNYKNKLSGYAMKINTSLVSDFLKTLPFELTKAQLKVLTEIKNDMLSDKPMNRLLQGDVGSGKTIVALISMLIAIDNGFQCALMAPTEILADQHAKNISAMMNKLAEVHPSKKIKVDLILGGQKKSDRTRLMNKIEFHETDIIIGTHALFEEDINFKNLGLVIIDEQHRFGVAQRARLLSKGKTPDTIVMSATPIPRTLSMTVYADLDLSTIDELPQNRKPVKTILRSENKLPGIYKFIVDKHKEGYQSFIVYPLVEESEKLELKAAQTFFDELQKTYLKDLKLGLIHGRMSWQEKEETMLMFLSKKFDVLVATTVIEVGIDIPDANIILINDAHRFGLSQLHQLRGRVGRSDKQAYCILVTKDEMVRWSDNLSLNFEYLPSTQIEKRKTILRLQTIVKYNDGFKIAEADLKLRGPGDIFGTKQSGLPELKHIDIVSDGKIIAEAKHSAFSIVSRDPQLKNSSSKVIQKNLVEHFKESLEYSKIA